MIAPIILLYQNLAARTVLHTITVHVLLVTLVLNLAALLALMPREVAVEAELMA